MLEHVYVYEEYYGIRLPKGWTIHHKNTCRDDNRIENLEAWPSNHGKGGRASDIAAWAEDVREMWNRLKKVEQQKRDHETLF